jgi:hypothetical protein
MGLLAREAELSALLRALVDRDHGPFTEPLRNVLASDPSISERIDDVRAAAGPHL